MKIVELFVIFCAIFTTLVALPAKDEPTLVERQSEGDATEAAETTTPTVENEGNTQKPSEIEDSDTSAGENAAATDPATTTVLITDAPTTPGATEKPTTTILTTDAPTTPVATEKPTTTILTTDAPTTLVPITDSPTTPAATDPPQTTKTPATSAPTAAPSATTLVPETTSKNGAATLNISFLVLTTFTVFLASNY